MERLGLRASKSVSHPWPKKLRVNLDATPGTFMQRVPGMYAFRAGSPDARAFRHWFLSQNRDSPRPRCAWRSEGRPDESS